MSIKRLTLALLAVFPLLSCDAPPNAPPVQYDYQIDSKILITPAERLSADSRSLIWNCRTEQTYSCANYRIVSSVARVGSVVDVRFQGINLSGQVCLTAPGPAGCQIDLGELPPGHYSVEFGLTTGTTKVDLLVEEGAYVVEPITGQSVAFALPVLRRIPTGTIWGLIEYLSVSPPPPDEPFLDSLAALGALPVNLETGDYGEFLIDSTGTMQWPGTHGYYHGLPYVRGYGGSSDSLRELVKYFGKTQGQRCNIRLTTWRGEQYLSWVLATEP